MATVKAEMDAAVADINEARQREEDDMGDPEEGSQARRCRHYERCTDGAAVAGANTPNIVQGGNKAGGTSEPQRDGCTIEPGRIDVEAAGRAPRPASEGGASTREATHRGCTRRRRHRWRRCVRHAWCANVVVVHIVSVAVDFTAV